MPKVYDLYHEMMGKRWIATETDGLFWYENSCIPTLFHKKAIDRLLENIV